MAVIPVNVLKAAGIDENASTMAMSGGDINQTFQIRSKNRHYFLKYHENPPSRFFQKEARQLSILGNTDGVNVPEVVRFGGHYLLLAWVEENPAPRTEEQLGELIADLHNEKGECFGFDEDNFIGTLPQCNVMMERWIDFYKNYRLLPQLDEADKRGHLPKERKKRAHKLVENLHQWLSEPAYPALLHGDLWAGNWLAGPDGAPYIIDPAISYGDPAFDRAMMALFGGFSARTMDSYHEKIKREEQEEEIVPIYQLYFLLAHLNMFGEMYGGGVDRILKRYVG
ncbi:fructosamine kinase family protein [Salicibibacter cibarius]|uniref:Fructosamine kinase family protein n=1 Tax=Salicibibacter cibarius TaxID=2743000 RepID=A0A7T6Z327_9BACI|nr:fructosamine kinase family protein [Salicibibacter cibarius]QQK75946.1 fructosamine kinase family protein [Salicibibacter cibarius]